MVSTRFLGPFANGLLGDGLFGFCCGKAYINFFNNSYAEYLETKDLVTFTLIINEAPYGKERTLSALRFAATADIEGHKVRIWLFENGVYLAKRDQKPAEGIINCGELLKNLKDGGAEVKVCVVCVESRGLTQADLMEGVKIATIHELIEWTVDSDKVIVF
jgi:tRNA 2-thiouridine synthesizing protein D